MTELLPICLNVDGSICAQANVLGYLRDMVDLREHESNLRLWANKQGAGAIRHSLVELRKKWTQPWLTFLGTGDLHHLSLFLLESLGQDLSPTTLILLDNHPDWFMDGKKYDCGDWLAGYRGLPWISEIIMLGQNSPDLDWYYFYTAPFQDLCNGKIRLHPFSRESVCVPFRWAKGKSAYLDSNVHVWGTELRFQTLQKMGIDNCFANIISYVENKNVYLSIDKDCLNSTYANTDWDQGAMDLQSLTDLVKGLRASSNLIGADITGEMAVTPIQGMLKRLDCGRFLKIEPSPSKEVHGRNEATNLALLDAFGCRA